MNRRSLINKLIGLAKAGVLGLILYPPLSFIVHRVPRLPVKIRVRSAPEKGLLLIENDFFLFPDPGGPSAISRICPHLGCRVNYNEKDNIFVCPCHGSFFTTEGEVKHGPALKNLPKLPVTFSREKGYIVTLNNG